MSYYTNSTFFFAMLSLLNDIATGVFIGTLYSLAVIQFKPGTPDTNNTDDSGLCRKKIFIGTVVFSIVCLSFFNSLGLFLGFTGTSILAYIKLNPESKISQKIRKMRSL